MTHSPAPDHPAPDYPVADYVPMAGAALTDAERWPLLTPEGAANLARLREHPRAPRYNHACGDRLTADAVAGLRAYSSTLDTARTTGGEPEWLWPLVRRVYATVPRHLGRPVPSRFTDVPVTTRHDLLMAVEDRVPVDADLSEVIVYRTSGSRGPAATVPMTPGFCATDLPVIEHVLGALGLRVAGGPDRVSLVNVYSQPIAYQFASVSSYWDGAGVLKVNLHPSAWARPEDRVAFLDDCAPELYTGNPLSLAALAELDPRGTPTAVLSGAMGLDEPARARLSARFGCPVVDMYGITEVGLIAWRTGGDHRVLPRELHVEILDPTGAPCPPGTVGEVTVTCGENPLLPLLRYRTGDHAALRHTPDGPVLVGLQGRDPVRYRAADNTWVHSIELTHVLSPLAMPAYRLHQAADGTVTVETHGPAPAAVAAAVHSLLGDVPLTVTPTDLTQETKPQRYTSDLPQPPA